MTPTRYNDIRIKCELALVAYLQANRPQSIEAEHISAGMESFGTENPKVRCKVDSAEHAPTNDGTWKCNARIILISDGDPQKLDHPEDAHRRLEGEILDLLMLQPQYMSSALASTSIPFSSDFAIVRRVATTYIDRQWQTEITMEIDGS